MDSMKYFEMGIKWENQNFAVRDTINEFYDIYYMFGKLKNRLDDLWDNRFPACFNENQYPIEIYMKIYNEKTDLKIEIGELINKIFSSYPVTIGYLLERFEFFVFPNLTKEVEKYLNERMNHENNN